jgi:hypothetical protein
VSILRDGEQAGLALLQLCEEFVLWRNDWGVKHCPDWWTEPAFVDPWIIPQRNAVDQKGWG